MSLILLIFNKFIIIALANIWSINQFTYVNYFY